MYTYVCFVNFIIYSIFWFQLLFVYLYRSCDKKDVYDEALFCDAVQSLVIGYLYTYQLIVFSRGTLYIVINFSNWHSQSITQRLDTVSTYLGSIWRFSDDYMPQTNKYYYSVFVSYILLYRHRISSHCRSSWYPSTALTQVKLGLWGFWLVEE